MKDIIKRANTGDINAINKLASECYTQRNDKEAFMWLKKGAELGSPISIANLAVFYAHGIYIEQDCEKALSLFVRAACLGEDIRDYVFEALDDKNLCLLANNGNANAQYYYALLVAQKNGPNAESEKYIQMALEKKMPLALAFKGISSLISDPSLDNKEASHYLITAIDNGYDYYALINNSKLTFNQFGVQVANMFEIIIQKFIKRKNDTRPFVLAKITSTQYVNSFIKKGEIYMQPLDNFRKSDKPGVGDMFEGVANTGANQLWSDMLQREAVSEFMQCGIYDDYMAHERLFCLYAIEFDEEGRAIKPDIRMRQFGESVILITNVKEFTRRLIDTLNKKHGDVWIGYGRVNYDVNFSKMGKYDEFSKTEKFAWQNEFRLVEDIANGRFSHEEWSGISSIEREKLNSKKDKTAYERLKLHADGMSDFAKLMALHDGCPTELYEEIGAEVIELGDLSDICKVFSIEDFLNLSPVFLDAVNCSIKDIWEYRPVHNKPFALRPIIEIV